MLITIYRFSPDYDVVAFLNGVTPDIEVLRHFKKVLREQLHTAVKKIKIIGKSLQFNLDGVEFDLLFARNIVKVQSTGNFDLLLWISINSSIFT